MPWCTPLIIVLPDQVMHWSNTRAVWSWSPTTKDCSKWSARSFGFAPRYVSLFCTIYGTIYTEDNFVLKCRVGICWRNWGYFRVLFILLSWVVLLFCKDMQALVCSITVCRLSSGHCPWPHANTPSPLLSNPTGLSALSLLHTIIPMPPPHPRHHGTTTYWRGVPVGDGTYIWGQVKEREHTIDFCSVFFFCIFSLR